MNRFESVAPSSLLISLLILASSGCGQLVEFGADDDASVGPSDAGGVGDSGSSGTGGAGGASDAGGASGTGGRGGAGGSGGVGGVDSGIDDGMDGGADDDSGVGIDSGANVDTTRPTLVSTSPSPAATGVALASDVTATFSEDLDPDSILTGGTFTVMLGSIPIAGVVTLDGDTATFNPNSPLADDTTYTASVSTGATDLAGNALASAAEWTFTTGDNIRPVLRSTYPVDTATEVPSGATLTATFSEDMATATFTDLTFTLMRGLTPIAGQVMLTGDTATFDPTGLLPDGDYTATISTVVTDLAGNTLGADATWTFTAGDTIRPVLVATDPMSDTTGVFSGTNVVATFSEDMAPATVTDTTFVVMQGVSLVPGSVVLVGATATFTPDVRLLDLTEYTASVSTEATDLAGNALVSDSAWTFTTGDSTPPEVTLVTPGIDAIDIPVNTLITATFSELLDPATVTAVTFTVMDGATPVDGSVMLVGDTATFTPDVDLDEDTDYTVTLSLGITDLAGNPLESDAVWTFTTVDTSAPVVLVRNPEDGDTQVALNKIITATFDDVLDESTVTTTSFSVMGPGAIPVTGMVSYDDVESVASFVPDLELLPNALYEVTITATVMDTSGNAMLLDEVWSFTTGTTLAQLDAQLAVPLGAASPFAILAAAGVSNIPLSTIIGDVGLSPAGGASITGFSMPGTCPEVNGTIYVVDATGPACATIDPVVITNAQLAAEVAYLDATASVRGTPQAISGDLNGLTLYPGLYESGSTIEISPGGILYLDAQGDSSAVFIIRSATSITTEGTSEVVLTKGAQANNVYWTAGSAITLGTNSIMKGTLIASTALSLLTGADLEGRALSQGPAATAVSLDTSTITVPSP